MTVEQAFQERFSCRSFLPKRVPEDTLREVLRAAFRSPSCENSQPWEIYVAGPQAMDALRKAFEANRRAKIPSDLGRRFDGKWTQEMGPRIDEYFDGIYRHDPRKNFDYTMQKRNLFYAPTMVFLCT